MSDAESKDEGLKNVELCYLALGLSISDPPDKIEITYKRLTDVYKANLAAADPKVRADASDSIKLISEMYEKITNSVTYKAMLDEQSRVDARNAASAAKSPRANVAVTKSTLRHCPMCNSVIDKQVKICPRCRARLYTRTEKVMNAVFTRTNVVIFSVLVLLGIIVFIAFSYPEQVKKLADLFAR